jgi:SAM-dependent methyltransferase
VSDALRVTRDTYALIAETFAATQFPPTTGLDGDLDWLAAQVPGGLVADIGCGPGRDTQALRSRGLRVVGLDLSDAMLRAGGLTGAAQADMRALPLRTESLDAIWCMAAFLHIPYEYANCAAGPRLRRAPGVRPSVRRHPPEIANSWAELTILAYNAAAGRRGSTLTGMVRRGPGKAPEAAAAYRP